VLILIIIGTPFITQVKAYDAKELDGFIPGDLIIVEPKNKAVYTDVVLLNIEHTSYGTYHFDLWGNGYSYSIDGQANITIPNGISPNIILTDLDEGEHCIIVYTSFYVAWGQLSGPYYYSSEPVHFSIKTDSQTTPIRISPTTLILIISMVSAIVIGSMIAIYKKSSLKQQSNKK